jgi:lysophospholipase L1-like esterase
MGKSRGDTSLVQLYKKIAKAAPNARIVVVGYPRFFPKNPPWTCATGAANSRFTRPQMTWINNEIEDMDTTIAAAVAATGNKRIRYVKGSYDAFKGHERCTDEPYLNGAIASKSGNIRVGSFHPNQPGHRLLARLVESTYRK